MESKQRSIGRNMMFNSVGSLFYLVCQWLLTVLVAVVGIMIFNKVERTFMDTV